MEQIVRIGDSLYYGKILCSSPDKAYRLFREDYHKEIGKDANRRLNREGQRTDVIHWSGFYFSTKRDNDCFPGLLVESRTIGIVHTSYCRILKIPTSISCEEYDRFIDWILSEGNPNLKLVGRKSGLGRTNKRHNINFR